MDKIIWCINQGMKLIEPNDNLADSYYNNAKETLLVANLSKSAGSNMWTATHKYYIEYLAAYAILMKIGIKSEIHSCTIEIIKLLENNKIINFDFSKILDTDKDLRIDNQYYLKNIPVEFDSKKLTELLLQVREILDSIDESSIILIRKDLLEKFIK